MRTVQGDRFDLDSIQRWMQSAIMHPGGIQDGMRSIRGDGAIAVGPKDVEQVLTRSKSQSALERLGIYHSAYNARLLECLREEYAVLAHALGRELFDEFAVAYLQRYPSRSYTLVQLGAGFPHYLAETRPVEDEGEEVQASWPDFLIDLATLERTFSEVFDGPGMEGQPTLDAEHLSAISEERWLEARLVPAPCLRLLVFRYPVHRYFTSVRRDGDAEMTEPETTFLAFNRRDYLVRHYELSRPAHEVLRLLTSGSTVGEAIAAAMDSAGPDLDHLARHLHQWFKRWAAEGFFRSVEFRP